jgi:hypothetical protein
MQRPPQAARAVLAEKVLPVLVGVLTGRAAVQRHPEMPALLAPALEQLQVPWRLLQAQGLLLLVHLSRAGHR